MSSTQTTATQGERRFGAGIYLAFAPWVLFSVTTAHDDLTTAAIIALAAAIGISAPSLLTGRPKTLEIGAIVAFAGLTIAALSVDAATGAWIARYARAIAASLLGLTALSSLLWTPFTEQYARESVPRELWSSPRFKQVNRKLTLLWAGVFAAMVPAHVLAGTIDTHRANTIFNWVIPVALVFWAIKRTESLSGESSTEETSRSLDALRA
jgi:hypothetical protein